MLLNLMKVKFQGIASKLGDKLLYIPKKIATFAQHLKRTRMKISRHILALSIGAALLAVPAAAQAEDTTAKEAIEQETPTVKAQPGGIVIEVCDQEGTHVMIYALTGQVVKQFDVPQGSTVVDLPTGYYIVRIGQTTKKVAVK